MHNLAAYFYSQGGDTHKVFSELNGEEHKGEIPDAITIRRTVVSEGGSVVCVENGKIIADPNPQNLGKDASFLRTTDNKPLLDALIDKMRKSAPKEEVVTYADLPTNVPDPADNTKMLTKRYVVVAYGRKTLLGKVLDKQHHGKFICYVAYPAK